VRPIGVGQAASAGGSALQVHSSPTARSTLVWTLSRVVRRSDRLVDGRGRIPPAPQRRTAWIRIFPRLRPGRPGGRGSSPLGEPRRGSDDAAGTPPGTSVGHHIMCSVMTLRPPTHYIASCDRSEFDRDGVFEARPVDCADQSKHDDEIVSDAGPWFRRGL